MLRIDIRVDVTEALSLDTHAHTAAWVYVPDSEVTHNVPIVTFAFPGGTYGRSYYDLFVPGRKGYSFAEHLAHSGHVVVACDHIGIGDSSPFEPFTTLTKDVVVSADHATVNQILTQLRAGTLADCLDPLIDPFVIGVGHSLGGYLLTRQQARYRSFDALAVLGFSQLRQPMNPTPSSRYDFRSQMPDPTRPPRSLFHKRFHDERVPADVIAADDALAARVYPWVWEPDPWGIMDDPESGKVALEIDVPVFLGFGSRDFSPAPRFEAQAYQKSTDITTFILPDSGHCFNFADTRELFFARLAAWGFSVSKTYVHRNADGSERVHQPR